MAILLAAAPVGQADQIVDPPKSIGPHKNIVELERKPPDATFQGDGSPAMERCLTIALSYGLGGAPLVTHEPGRTMIVSLFPRTYGIVSSMIIIRGNGQVEYRGYEKFELNLVRQCLGQPATK